MTSVSDRIRDFDFVRALDRCAGLRRPALFSLLLANVVALMYYLLVGYRPEFHSDSAVKNLLAQEVVNTGQYFPVDWNYVNGDLWTLFGQIFIIPLLGWFPNGYALHAVSGFASAILILGGGWLISGLVTRSLDLRLLILGVMAGGVSTLLAENLYGQVSYGNVFFIASFTLYFAWRFLGAGQRNAIVAWGIALFVLTTLAFWGNPQRAVAYNALPLTAASLVWGCSEWTSACWRVGAFRFRAVWLGAVVAAGAVAGVVLHSWVIAHVNNVPGAGSARWLSFPSLLGNVGYTLQGMVDVFGGTLPTGAGVMTLGGAYMALRFVAALALLALIPVALTRALRDSNDSTRFVGAFAASSLALFLFLHITTTTPDMSDPSSSARYLVPASVFCLIVVIAKLGDATLAPRLRVTTLGLATLLALAPVSPLHSFSRIWTGSSADNRMELVQLLEREGLHYGYATYWNAGALSVLSDQRVLVRQIRLSTSGLPEPMRHLNSNRWYRREAWSGQTFLMLTADEWSRVSLPRLVAIVGNPERELHWGGFRILVFGRNLAELPGWADRFAEVGAVSWQADDGTMHSAGQVASVDGRRALVARAGESGYLSYGQYIALPAGRYAVEFDVRGRDGAGIGQDLGRVDVAIDSGATSIAALPIQSGGSAPLRLEFELPRSEHSVEFRTQVFGAEEVRFFGVSLQPVRSASRLLAR